MVDEHLDQIRSHRRIVVVEAHDQILGCGVEVTQTGGEPAGGSEVVLGHQEIDVAHVVERVAVEVCPQVHGRSVVHDDQMARWYRLTCDGVECRSQDIVAPVGVDQPQGWVDGCGVGTVH